MNLLKIVGGTVAATLLLSYTNYDPFDGNELYTTVQKYVDLGEHRTGTPGDTATSYWLHQELKSLGYDVKYLEFRIRQFFAEKVFLTNGKDTINGFPLWWVNEKADRIVRGPLTPPSASGGLRKKIVVIHLPIKGQSFEATASHLDSLASAGASGIVAITDNLSGEIQEYNTARNAKPWKVPVVLIAPKDSARVAALTTASQLVTLAMNGSFKDVTARNVIGTIGHGKEYVVVSTPISGWFTCGGERGSGIAIWLALAKWAATINSRYTFVFTANSGHEHAFMGAHQYLESAAPPVNKTHLWVHFGAGAATLKYTGSAGNLLRQHEADDKRRFFYNDSVARPFLEAFTDVPGDKVLEAKNPGGELAYVARKGYRRFAGVTYAHPFFHVPADDASTTSPEILASTAIAFKNFISEDIR